MLSICTLVSLLVACADGEERGYQPIVQLDMGRLPDVDAPDQMTTEVDRGPPEAIPAERELWLMYLADEYVEGVRAHLDPPQRPLMTSDELVDVLLPEVVVMEWRGPMTPSDQRLAAYATRNDLKVIPFYRPPEGSEFSVETVQRVGDDARYLIAQYGGARSLYRQNERPVIALDWSTNRGTGARLFSEALNEVDVPVFWAGPALDSQRFPGDVSHRWTDCHDLERPIPSGRGEVLMCFGPAPWGDLGESSFIHRSIHTRLKADQEDVPVLVYGVSAWSDDRQLCPIDGQATDQPSQWTEGQFIEAYGFERLRAVERHVRVAQPMDLMDLVGTSPMALYGEGALDISESDDALSLRWRPEDAAGARLLNPNPIVLPADVRLEMERMSLGLSLIFVFADGHSLSIERPGVSDVLSPGGPRRLEDIILEYRSVDGETELFIDGLRLVPDE